MGKNEPDDIEAGQNYSFGPRLGKLLKARGGTIAKAAREIDCEPANLRNWVSGRYEPSLVWLARISDYTGASLDYLVRGEEAPCFGQIRHLRIALTDILENASFQFRGSK